MYRFAPSSSMAAESSLQWSNACSRSAPDFPHSNSRSSLSNKGAKSLQFPRSIPVGTKRRGVWIGSFPNGSKVIGKRLGRTSKKAKPLLQVQFEMRGFGADGGVLFCAAISGANGSKFKVIRT